jgi:hypothetical protein
VQCLGWTCGLWLDGLPVRLFYISNTLCAWAGSGLSMNGDARTGMRRGTNGIRSLPRWRHSCRGHEDFAALGYQFRPFPCRIISIIASRHPAGGTAANLHSSQKQRLWPLSRIRCSSLATSGVSSLNMRANKQAAVRRSWFAEAPVRWHFANSFTTPRRLTFN